MKKCTAIIALLSLISSTIWAETKPILDSPDGLRAFNDLAAYYADEKAKPPYEKALSDLSAGHEAAQHAGQYLLGLFEQCLEDETNGRAVWKRQPYWGGGSESPSREFRKELAGKIGESASGEEILPVALWLIDEEKLPEGEAAGIKILRRIHAKAAEDALKRILSKPHPNQEVLLGAIDEVGKRNLNTFKSQIVDLESSYRTAVRTAANKTAQLFGEKQTPPFQPDKAFTPALSALLRKIADRVPTQIPANAQWVDIVYTSPDANPGSKPRTDSGWLLRDEAEKIVILDVMGMETSLPKKSTQTTPSSLSDYAKTLVKLRQSKSREEREKLSIGGVSTAQFEPSFISVPEALVAAWSFIRDDKATAAAVLFPCFDQAADDRWIDWTTRDMLGNRYHQKMLEHFSIERDYAAALELAQHLSKPVFDGFNYQDRAKELAKQLPARMEDFKTFTLPSPEDWEKEKVNLKRVDQVAFLGAHLRLLNCMQMSQPGGVSYSDPQYSHPFPTMTNSANPVVINPYNELEKMGLTPEDIQTLLPYAIDNNFIPTFSYWRNFHPARTLHRVSWVVVELINSAANQTLVNLQDLDSMNEADRQKELDKMKRWCEAHKGKTSVDLLAETLQTTKNDRDFLAAAQKALKQKQIPLLKLATARLGDFPKAKITQNIARMCFESEAPDFVEQARTWIKDTNAQAAADASKPPKPANAPVYFGETSPSFADYNKTRFWSALILLRDGDHSKMEGLDVLQPLLKADDGSFYYPHAIPTLLATKNEMIMALACEVLKKPEVLTSPWDAGDQIRRLFLAGRPECRDFLISALDDSTQDKNGFIARTICGWRTDHFQINPSLPNAEQVKKRQELKKWINDQFQLIQQGKTPDMITKMTSSIPEWHIDAP